MSTSRSRPQVSHPPPGAPQPNAAGATTRFIYVQRQARCAPASGVQELWALQAERCRAAVEAALPDAAAEIYFNLGPTGRRVWVDTPSSAASPACRRGAWVVGPRADTLLVEKETRDCDVVVVRLRPGVASQVLGAPTSELSGRLVDLTDLWGPVVEQIREQVAETTDAQARLTIVEQAIAARVVRAGAATTVARVDAVCSAVVDQPDGTIAGVAARLGLTHRQVIRFFDDHVGLTPKLFQRVQRFRWVLEAIGRAERPAWARIAARAGYHDQAHFIHDFRRLAGMRPTAYAALRLRVGNGSVPHRLAPGEERPDA
jgi:methylphosphotriester-DNA--protein-cysteine methyltransferase